MLDRRRFLLSAAALAAGGAQAKGPARASGAGEASPRAGSRPEPFRPPAPLRGMTVSCPTYGPVWGSSRFRSCLDELKGELGVRWVAIHPYARVGKDGEVAFRRAVSTGYLERAVQHAQKVGVQLFFKPHLAYWGSFAWRGAIAFDDEASWRRFFRGYRAFILDQARFCQAAAVPLFCLGTELERTVHRPEWSAVLDEVRVAYSGPITWAANWDGVGRVPFWSSLDAIGVQGYFPVGKGAATKAQIRAGWELPLAALENLSERHGRRVLLTELGYARNQNAAARPWEPAMDERAAGLRERLMDVALEQLWARPWMAGAFWWKWIPGPARHDGDFSMKDAEARRVLRRHWA